MVAFLSAIMAATGTVTETSNDRLEPLRVPDTVPLIF
jgi:hypothetical protein